MSGRARLAYFSPLPPTHSGIADYSRELLPFLSHHFDIEVFTDYPERAERSLAEQFCLRSTLSYPARRWHYDAALYQMGNSAHHELMYQVFLHYPGIVVLHDHGLHHFIAGRTVQHNFAGYVRELGYALGPEGIQWARDFGAGKCSPPLLTVPLNDRLLDLSLAVIVHSRYACEQIRQRRPQQRVFTIPAPIRLGGEELAPRNIPEWPADAVVFGSFGQVTAAKRLDQALRAFACVHDVLPQARYLIVGEWNEQEVGLSALIRQLGLQEVVRCIGYVRDLDEFIGWIGAAHIVVNLRNPTLGETSATALRALAAGRPLIVSDHGWYAELPDEVCIKAPPDDEAALQAAMLRLAQDATMRHALGERAARFAAAVHAVPRVADAYAGYIGRLLDELSRTPASGLA